MAKRDITPRQNKAIGALLTARSLTEAAATAGIALRTLQRWLDDASFVAALKHAEAQAIDIAARRLTQLSGTAIDTLGEVMRDDEASAPAKVSAASATLTQLSKLRELNDLEQRIERLERSANDSKR